MAEEVEVAEDVVVVVEEDTVAAVVAGTEVPVPTALEEGAGTATRADGRLLY